MGGTGEPHDRFLALQPAQAGFKPLKVAGTYALVTALGGWLFVSTAWSVRKRSFKSMRSTERVMRAKVRFIGPDTVRLGMIAQASWGVNRRKRPRASGGKLGRYRGLRARSPRRVRRAKRIAVILDRMPIRASTLTCLVWRVTRAKQIIVVLGRVSFCGSPCAHLIRHLNRKVGVKRLQ